MPGRKQNQAKQNKNSNGFNPDAPEIQKKTIEEEFEAATNVCWLIQFVNSYTNIDTEAKKSIVAHLQDATEYEGWSGRIAFAWGFPADETLKKDKVCSITDRKEYDDGFIITIFSKLSLREETIANMKTFEGVIREKYGDNFRVEVCGSLPCCHCGKRIRIEYCNNLTNEECGEMYKDHQALKLQTNEQADVITRQMAEIAELKAENEEFTRQVDEGELVPSEDVVCSYHDLSDYNWGRVKDIIREENLNATYPYFDEVAITNELQSAMVLKGENEKLKAENEKLKAELVGGDKHPPTTPSLKGEVKGELPSEDVVCSYHDLSDYNWGRVKDIIREENLNATYPYFDEVAITNELQSAMVLKGENEKLKAENEKLKAELVGGDKHPPTTPSLKGEVKGEP